jgi:hypothetical protein
MFFFYFQQPWLGFADFLTNASNPKSSNPKSTKTDPFSSCAKVIV